MAEHRCDDCRQTFTTGAGLRKHKNRKKSCTAGEYLCRKDCGKRLADEESRRVHEKKCGGLVKSRQELLQDAKSLEAELARKDDTHKHNLTVTTIASNEVINGLFGEHRPNAKLVLDRNKLCVRNAVGSESLEHLKGRDIHDLLEGLQQSPATIVRWFWLLRGPDLQQNHNVLIVPGATSQALLYRTTGWATTDCNTALKEVIRSDIKRLYDFLGKWENDREIKDFKFHYVCHIVMSDVNSDDGNILKHVVSAIVEQLEELTCVLYAERSINSTPQEMMAEEYEGNLRPNKEDEQRIVELRLRVAKRTEANRLIFHSSAALRGQN